MITKKKMSTLIVIGVLIMVAFALFAILVKSPGELRDRAKYNEGSESYNIVAGNEVDNTILNEKNASNDAENHEEDNGFQNDRFKDNVSNVNGHETEEISTTNINAKNSDSENREEALGFPENSFTDNASNIEEQETKRISTPYINVETIKAQPGDSRVAVSVSIHNNPGIIGMTLSVLYDDTVLTLTDVSKGEALSTLNMTIPGEFSSQCRLLWDGQEIKDNDVKDGDILTLYFDVSDSALEAIYPIRFFCNDGDIVDNNLETVSITIFNGAISVGQ